MKWGILFRWRSLWIGAHWSPYDRRLCINLLPMITLWIVWPGGITPSQEQLRNGPTATLQEVMDAQVSYKVRESLAQSHRASLERATLLRRVSDQVQHLDPIESDKLLAVMASLTQQEAATHSKNAASRK